MLLTSLAFHWWKLDKLNRDETKLGLGCNEWRGMRVSLTGCWACYSYDLYLISLIQRLHPCNALEIINLFSCYSYDLYRIWSTQSLNVTSMGIGRVIYLVNR